MARRPVDEKIVKLTLDHRDFAKRVMESTTLFTHLTETLNKIPGINLGKSVSEMSSLKDVVSGIDFENIHSGVDGITTKMSTFSIVTKRMLENLTDSAMGFVSKLGKSVWNQAVTAGKNRATNIEQAAFQFKGLGMDVEKSMASAEYATTGTSFGLDEAAIAASQLGASGIEAGDDMSTALRAISGVAAMTNSTYGDTANIFTTVAGNGKLMTMQMQQLAGRGLNVAAILAEAFGVSEGALREMVTAGKVSFEDFYSVMDKKFGEHATSSRDTFTGAIAAMKAAVTRIGATMWTPIITHGREVALSFMAFFNNIHAAVKEVMVDLTPIIISAFAGARKFVEGIDFTNLGGTLSAITRGFINIGRAIGRVFKPMTEVFKPFMNSLDSPILTMAKGFETLTERLILSEKWSNRLAKVFEFLGKIIEAVLRPIRFITSAFITLVDFVFTKVTRSIDVTADAFVWIGTKLKEIAGNIIPSTVKGFNNFRLIMALVKDVAITLAKAGFEILIGTLQFLGDRLVILWEHLQNGINKIRDSQIIMEAWNYLIETVGGTVNDFIEYVKNAADWNAIWSETTDVIAGSTSGLLGHLKDLLNWGVDWETVEKWIADGLYSIADGFKGLVSWAKEGIETLKEFAKQLKTSVGEVIEWVIEKFNDLKTIVTNIAQTFFDKLDVKDAAMIGALIALLTIVHKLRQEKDEAVTFLDGVSAAITNFTDSFEYTKLIAIAGSIAILVWAMVQLKDMDSTDIIQSLSGVGGALLILVGGLKMLDGVQNLNMGTIGNLLAMAVVLKTLATALTKMSEIDSGDYTRAVWGVIGMIGALAGALSVMAKSGAGSLELSAIGITAVATAVLIMTEGVARLAALDANQMILGLLGMMGILSALSMFTVASKGGTFATANAIGLILLAAAVKAMIGPVTTLGKMDAGELSQGLLGVTAAVLAVSTAARIAGTPDVLAGGVGIAVIAGALMLLVLPLQLLATMDSDDLAQGLLAMAFSIMTVSVAAKVAGTPGTLAGGAAIAIIAGALLLLTIPIGILGSMDLKTLAIGIGGMAAALIVIGGTAALLGLVSAPILAFAGALMTLGVSLVFISAGILLTGIGLTLIAGSVAGATIGIVKSLGVLLDGLGRMIDNIVEFGVKLILALLSGIVQVVPAIGLAVVEIVLGLLKIIAAFLPRFIEIGMDIIVSLIDGFAEKLPDLILALSNLVIQMIDGLTAALEENGPRFIKAFMSLLGEVLILFVVAGVEVIRALFGWIPGVDEALTNVSKTAEDAMREHFNPDDIASDKIGEYAAELSGTESQGIVYDAGYTIAGYTDDGLSDYDFSSTGGAHGKQYGGGFGGTRGDNYAEGVGVAQSTKEGAETVKFDGSGKVHGKEYASGLESTHGVVKNSGVYIADYGVTGLTSVSTDSAGSNFTTGFSRGMGGQGVMRGVRAAAVNVATSAWSSLKNTLGIASPAKVLIQSGGFFSQGFGIGISNMTDFVSNKARNLAQKAINVLSETMDSLENPEVRVGVVYDYDKLNIDRDAGTVPVDLNTTTDFASRASTYNNQNGNKESSGDNSTTETNNNNYDIHIHAQGELPRSTIKRMAGQFKEELDTMDRTRRINRGEEVVV